MKGFEPLPSGDPDALTIELHHHWWVISLIIRPTENQKMVRLEGIEPSPLGLRIRSSAIKLQAHR